TPEQLRDGFMGTLHRTLRSVNRAVPGGAVLDPLERTLALNITSQIIKGIEQMSDGEAAPPPPSPPPQAEKRRTERGGPLPTEEKAQPTEVQAQPTEVQAQPTEVQPAPPPP